MSSGRICSLWFPGDATTELEADTGVYPLLGVLNSGMVVGRSSSDTPETCWAVASSITILRGLGVRVGWSSGSSGLHSSTVSSSACISGVLGSGAIVGRSLAVGKLRETDSSSSPAVLDTLLELGGTSFSRLSDEVSLTKEFCGTGSASTDVPVRGGAARGNLSPSPSVAALFETQLKKERRLLKKF